MSALLSCAAVYAEAPRAVGMPLAVSASTIPDRAVTPLRRRERCSHESLRPLGSFQRDGMPSCSARTGGGGARIVFPLVLVPAPRSR